MQPGRVLLVDFNNFSRYPTVAIGVMAAALRRAGFEVVVYSPFAQGIKGLIREHPVRIWSLIEQRIRFWTSTAQSPLFRRIRKSLGIWSASQLARDRRHVVADLGGLLDGVDAVLVSTYLMYHRHCVDVAAACEERGLPVIIGSQYFTVPDVVREWRDLGDSVVLVGGEVELKLAELVSRVIQRKDVGGFPGVLMGDHPVPAPPLTDLDSVPFPDYADFPWERYPNRIIPIITGRGCGWGVCTFCSDVITGAGRTYRSRTAENVLEEARHQSERHDTNLFVFTDLKLNSDPDVWTAVAKLDAVVPGARWIGAVHVDPRDRRLDRKNLDAIFEGGCRRLTTGLESGSQRILDRMRKGTRLARTSQFLQDARRSGISIRTTMIVGSTGEEARDVDATRGFLEDHADCIERVRLNRMNIMSGTSLYRQVLEEPAAHDDLILLAEDHRMGALDHVFSQNREKDYRKAINRLLKTVHGINRRPVLHSAHDFVGVM